MSDIVLDYMRKHKIPLTQQNYIELAYMGDKHSLEELEAVERALLPDNFEEWPRSDREIQ